MWRLDVEQPAANVVGPVLPRLFQRRDGSQIWLCATPWGDWMWLEPSELTSFLRGAPSDELRARLKATGLLHGEVALADAAKRLAHQLKSLNHGPQHVTVHLSRGRQRSAGPLLERAIDVAFVSTSHNLAIEIVVDGFDGDVQTMLEEAIVFARDKNRLAFKALRVVVRVGATAWRQDAALQECLDRMAVDLRIVVSEAADLIPASDAADDTGASTVQTMDVEAVIAPQLLLALPAAELVSRLGRAGYAAAQLEPPAPWDGVNAALWLSKREDFIGACLAAEPPLVERTTARICAKVIKQAASPGSPVHRIPDDPMWRAPAGDGLGTFSVDADGAVGSSEDALALARLGDPLFILGTIDRLSYHELVGHEAVVSALLASIPEGQPGCSKCAFMRWCAIRPGRNVAEHGSPFPNAAQSDGCKISTGIVSSVFARLAEDDGFAPWGFPG